MNHRIARLGRTNLPALRVRRGHRTLRQARAVSNHGELDRQRSGQATRILRWTSRFVRSRCCTETVEAPGKPRSGVPHLARITTSTISLMVGLAAVALSPAIQEDVELLRLETLALQCFEDNRWISGLRGLEGHRQMRETLREMVDECSRQVLREMVEKDAKAAVSMAPNRRLERPRCRSGETAMCLEGFLRRSWLSPRS